MTQSDSTSLVGMEIGPYLVLAQIGRGGMGQVYRARDPALGRDVAIKVLPSQMAGDPQFVARFQREAAIVGQLLHPNILPCYVFGEHEGMLYIVMAYVPGGTLLDLIEQSGGLGLNLESVGKIVGPIADALDYAHRLGVVHRDLKPANILISPSGSPLVADFGIARIAQERGLTQTGAAVGTPQYMSPEQGLGQPVDGRSDIYALGIILYQMLTGRAPFDAESSYAVIHKQIYEPLPLPTAIRPDLPPAVEQVVLVATAKAPESRFQTAAMFRAALDSALLGAREAESPNPPGPANVASFVQVDMATGAVVASDLGAITQEMEAAPLSATAEAETGVILSSADSESMNSLRHRTRAAWSVLNLVALCLVVGCVGIALALILRPAFFDFRGTRDMPTEVIATRTPTSSTPSPSSTASSTTAAAAPATPLQPVSPNPRPPAVEDNVWAAAQRSNEVWADAIRRVDSTRLSDVYAGKALEEITLSVTKLKEQGRYRVVEPIDIQRLGVEVSGERSTVRTREQWRDRVYLTASNAIVSARDPWVFSQTYVLQLINGRWLVVDTILQ